MLMSLAEKRLMGVLRVESAVANAALQAAAPVHPVVAVWANTLAKRMGRDRNQSLASIANSSASMAESSRRRSAATVLRVDGVPERRALGGSRGCCHRCSTAVLHQRMLCGALAQVCT